MVAVSANGPAWRDNGVQARCRAWTMPGLNQPLLINILGHAGGALIFAIFLFLLFSGRGWSGPRSRYLPGLAAGLSLVWNLGSLVVLVRPNIPAVWFNLVVAVSFSVLSFLPAVL